MPSFKATATSMFGNIVDKYAGSFPLVKDNLIKANMKIPYRTYMSMLVLTTIIVYVSMVISLTVLFVILKLSIFMIIAFVSFIPMIGAMVCLVFMIFYPYQKVQTRKNNIETNLPFVLTHMGAIAESGIPPYVIFKLISQFREYGEVANEMRRIVHNIDSFGLDPLTAVKQSAERSPSNELKQVLLGFVSTTESGGDIKNYLKNAGERALFEWRMKRERFLQQLDAYAEIYTGLFIAAPLFIVSIFAVMNMIQPSIGGYSILELMRLSVYVIVPVLNTGFIMFLRGVEVEM